MSNSKSIMFQPTAAAGGALLRASAVLGLLGAASVAWGAVSLDITKPPVNPPNNGAGPLQDPNAVQGQWFLPNGPNAEPFVRSHEFYDNIQGQGGGNMNHLAIQGNVTVINGGTWSFGLPINSFTVHATVTNDTHTWDNSNWVDGSNSHGEFRPRQPGDPYVGDLVSSWLTVEFAMANLLPQPLWMPPYTQQVPEIIATNEDAAAWYCYNQLQDPANPGNYFVPAWDFGTIPVGMTAFRDLTFVVNLGGILPGDPRYGALTEPTMDILMNRTTDLKIGDWVDVPAIDPGTPYPLPAARSGNASLFHIPEASTASILGLLGLLGLRRRR